MYSSIYEVDFANLYAQWIEQCWRVKSQWNMVTAHEASNLVGNPDMQADHYARDSLGVISTGFQATTSDAFNPAS